MNIRTLTLSTLLYATLFSTDAAAQAPSVFLSDTSFSPTVDYQGNGSVNLTIGNSGDAPLEWEISIVAEEDPSFEGQPLEDTLRIFDRQFTDVTDLIPNRFDFTEGVTGTAIIDGGQDKFDIGNILTTNIASFIPYSDGIIIDSDSFGENGSYFTRKYPGLFLLAAEISDIIFFEIEGRFGNNAGSTNAPVDFIHDKVYSRLKGSLFKHVINFLIITPDDPEIWHRHSNFGYRPVVEKLNNINRIYYLLYASENGSDIDDEQSQKIFEAAVKILNPQSEWLNVNRKSGVVQADNAVGVIISFDSINISSGTYEAILQIETNDPVNTDFSIPVTLTVQDPEPQIISVYPVQIDFDRVAIGSHSSHPITIANTGEDFLRISSVILEGDKFSMEDMGEILLDRGESIEFPISFNPNDQGNFTGTIKVNSNDLIYPEISIVLSGESRKPVTSQSSSELTVALDKDQSLVKPINITNSGEGVLQWSVSNPEFFEDNLPLEEVLVNFDDKFENVTELIPNRFDFEGGMNGILIDETGGNRDDPHLYDVGNFLSTNHSGRDLFVQYRNGTITDNAFLFGENGRYFTKKQTGLFLFAADVKDVEYFAIDGATGNIDGISDGTILDYENGANRYLGFVRRIYGSLNPSINHLVIIPYDPNVDHDFVEMTWKEEHRLFNIENVKRIYYLLFSGAGGQFIDDATMQSIMETFLDSIRETPDWVSAEVAQGTVEPNSSTTVNVVVDSTGLLEGDYETTLTLTTNEPGRVITEIPVHLSVFDSLPQDISTFSSTPIPGFPGWRNSPWYKNYNADGLPWIFHDEHGWQFVLENSTNEVIFVWDQGLQDWLFFNENTYRWMFMFGENTGWIWTFGDNTPGSRFFQRGDDGSIFSIPDGLTVD